jgi:hypothetical protein
MLVRVPSLPAAADLQLRLLVRGLGGSPWSYAPQLGL